MPNQFETISNPIPEKCRDCPIANFTIAALSSFEGSTGGPENYLNDIEESCPGYDIAPSDATVVASRDVETTHGRYTALSVSSHSQLARCAMHLE